MFFIPPTEVSPQVLIDSDFRYCSAMAAPSVLEYARYNELALDYLSRNPRELLKYYQPLRPASIHSAEFWHDTVAQEYSKFLVEPRLQLKQEASLLLTEGMNPKSPPCWDNMLDDHHRIAKIKADEPILLFRHGKDVKGFRQSLYSEAILEELQSCMLPDGPGFLQADSVSGIQASTTSIDEHIQEEKIQVEKPVLRYIQHKLNDSFPAALLEVCFCDSLDYEKV